MSHWSEWLSSKILQTINAGESVEEKKPSCTVGGNVNRWRRVWRVLKKLGIKLPYDRTIPPSGIYPEENIIEKDACILVFTAALFIIARTWTQPRCSSTD